MTYFDAIRTNPTFVNLPTDVVETAFISRGVESTDDYTASGLENLELITADLYVIIATTPEFREGALMVKYNTALLLSRARNFYLKYEDPKIAEIGGNKINLNITKA